ncbi:PepSY domain-containing protein [Domibacillus indicus]|uniref:PepSY domain-containing protein n=1 Tax=Domibacillus indicus TaxID=1437523 RepID=UPI0006977540|nr:PepSY domain-containing protein [Domibacillus indicus]
MRKVILLIIAGAALAAAFVFYSFFRQAPPTIAEAGEKLARQYNGTVVQSEEKNGQFVYILQVTGQGAYELAVNSGTGELIKLARLSEIKKEDAALEAETPFIQEESTRMLTAEEAGQIALTKVPGTIEEAELGDEEEAGSYLIDIETKSGEEATVQVNAISGGIMSITWDD